MTRKVMSTRNGVPATKPSDLLCKLSKTVWLRITLKTDVGGRHQKLNKIGVSKDSLQILGHPSLQNMAMAKAFWMQFGCDPWSEGFIFLWPFIFIGEILRPGWTRGKLSSRTTPSENADLWSTALPDTSTVQSRDLRLRDQCRRGGRKIARARGPGSWLWNYLLVLSEMSPVNIATTCLPKH